MRAQDMLPDAQNEVERDGVVVRKGSVGAFLVNAKVWGDPTADAAARAAAERDMIELVPALRVLGLFDVLAVKDDALRALVDAH